MAAIVDTLRAHLNRPRRPAEAAIDCLVFVLFLSGVAYLLAKSYQVSEAAGYDFKFIWLAGEAWQRGINPYAAEYLALGKDLISTGHVPDLWVYPPNWYLPAILVALVNLDTASFLWSLSNVAMLVAASALLTAAFPVPRFESQLDNALLKPFGRILATRWNLFFLHLWAIAILQATAINLSVGQTAIVVYFGLSLLIFGLAKDREMIGAFGLTVMLLKPQVAALIVVVLAMSRARHRLLAKAAVVSAVISLPAFIVAPTAAFDFLANLTAYDQAWSASAPQSTTGLRHLVWTVSGLDPGNMIYMVAALLLMVGLALSPLRARADNDGAALVVLASTVVIAVVPLHVYDLMLVGAPLFILARARSIALAAGSLGAVMLWRAGDVARVTGLYGEGTEHFEGTRLATFGSILILIAVFETIRRQRA